MKKLLTTLSLSSVLFSGISMAQDNKEITQKQVDKESYAVGFQIVTSLQRNLNSVEESGIKLNKDKILEAIEKGLLGKNKMSAEEANIHLQNLQKRISKSNQKKLRTKATKNKIIAEQFLEENKNKEGVITLPSGLQYKVLKESKGQKPLASNTVKVHYKGTLINGEVFDTSYKRNVPAEFKLNGVIKGWTEGLQLMSVGSKYKFFISPELAYGENSTGRIEPNSLLIFEVELLEVK